MKQSNKEKLEAIKKKMEEKEDSTVKNRILKDIEKKSKHETIRK